MHPRCFKLVQIWIVSAGLLTLSLRAESTVEQWGVYEGAFPGPTNGNPFTNVLFSVWFHHQDTSIEIRGFYDGNGVYRARFMPEIQGSWHYVTRSSARELNAITGEFTVTAPSRYNHGPVRVAHTYHFAYADGTPYEERGTTCYNWIHQNEALQEETLQTLAAAPFNKVRMCVFPGDWDTNGQVLYPYEVALPDRPDFSQFNPRFFQHLETRIRDLQKLGIEADLILFNPYGHGHLGFDQMPDETDAAYLHYLVARLSAYRNVWWSLANEWDLMKQKNESDFVRFGEIVAADDPYHHLLSIHNSAKLFNDTLPWITHASIQNGSAVENPASAELYRDVYRKPVVYDEMKYEGDFTRRWGNLSGQELVYRFWNATVAGTYAGHGETFTNLDNIVWTSDGGALHGQSPARLAFLKNVLAASPPEGIEPIDKWQNPEYGGQSGKYYLVYLGKQRAPSWRFRLPKAVTANGIALTNGMQFTAQALDTWNMTVTPAPGLFTISKESDYFYADEDGRSISLPGKPYMAIRITRASR